jgi:outer membrane protein, heavy metal efflux system
MWSVSNALTRWAAFLCAGLGVFPSPSPVRAQDARRNELDSLISRALAVNPTIMASRRRVDVARARVGAAGARPDPMLMAGIQNQPLGREAPMASVNGVSIGGGPDPMTMRVLGVSQTILYPGKSALRTAAAQHDVDAASAALAEAQLSVAHDVRVAYFELAYVDHASMVVEQNRRLLDNIIAVTESHYATGSGTQQDILKARVEAARLGEDANALREQRRAQTATLSALLDEPSDATLPSLGIPERIARAAVSDSVSRIRFTSDSLGAPAADSPLPSLAALQAMAIENSPMLREHEARIAAQTSRVAYAEKATRPDIDVSLQYGQRTGLTDMVSAVVSLPIPIRHGRKQDADVAAERSELSALEAEHHAQLNEIRSRVARLYADLERERTQLALTVKAILPQGRAAVAATTASYQTGKGDVLAVLDARATLFTYETSYYRALSDFAETLADLEQVVGKEVLP